MIQRAVSLLSISVLFVLHAGDYQKQSLLAACEQQYRVLRIQGTQKAFCWLEVAIQQCHRNDERACAFIEQILREHAQRLDNKSDQCSYEAEIMRIARWALLRHRALKLSNTSTNALQQACEQQFNCFHVLNREFCWLQVLLQRCQEHDKQACDFLQYVFDEHMVPLCHQKEFCKNRVGCDLLIRAFGIWIAQKQEQQSK